MVCYPRESRRRRFRASNDEEAAVGCDLHVRDSVSLAVGGVVAHHLQDVRQEVPPLLHHTLLQPLPRRICDVRFMLGPRLAQRLRSQQTHDLLHVRVGRHGPRKRADLDRVEDALHPAVVLPAAETAERLAQGQVADDVEGREVVPLHHVHGLSCQGEFAETDDEQVDVRADQGLLFSQGLVREGRRQESAQSDMVCAVRGPDGRCLVGYLGHIVPSWIFFQRAVVSIAVDIPPGLLADERQLVWGKSHDIAVLLVEALEVPVQAASHCSYMAEEDGGEPELGAGEGAEGVEVDVVDGVADGVGDLTVLAVSIVPYG